MRGLDGLERVSVVLVVSGLVVMFAASALFSAPDVSLSSLDASRIGDTVRVEAKVTSFREIDTVQFLTLQQGEARITGVYFGNSVLEVVPGELHRVEGTVEVYEGELELIVDSIQPADE